MKISPHPKLKTDKELKDILKRAEKLAEKEIKAGHSLKIFISKRMKKTAIKEKSSLLKHCSEIEE